MGGSVGEMRIPFRQHRLFLPRQRHELVERRHAPRCLATAHRPLDARAPFLYMIAIVVTAIVFGAGHLPAAATVAPLDAALVTRILLLNCVAGIVYGALFWRCSLEAAMVAHMSTHVAFAIARFMQWT